MKALGRRRPAGLRLRLALWVATVLLASTAVIFLVVYDETGSELHAQINRSIAGDSRQVAEALRPLRGAPPSQIAAAARRYMLAQPYTANSTLLFALIPGQPTASNHPEVFGTSAKEDGESLSEQVEENAAGRRLQIPKPGYSTQRIPDVGTMQVDERAVLLGSTRVITGAGEPLTVVSSAQHDLARAFLLGALLVLVLALAASYLAGARVSAPLRRMAAVAARVDAGDLKPRMEVAAGRHDEVHVLAEAFNHMLDRLGEAFKAQREFVDDASHELRTPLTVIRGQLEVLAAQDAPDAAEVRRVEGLVQAELTRISRLVDDLLALARADQANSLRAEAIDLRDFLTDLWDGLSLTADRRFELGAIPAGVLRADPDLLARALRNLARNAVEHTAEGTGLVRLEVERQAQQGLRLAVVDDGSGIPADERQRVFERFHRVDGARSRRAGGAGLGLAIVQAIAEAHGGHARVADPRGQRGARIELVLPGFEPR